jgi:hypothetical protein
VFSLTVMVVGAAALVAAKAIGVCACRPRVTARPPPSEVVVRTMETCSPAASAVAVGRTAAAVAASSTLAATHSTFGDEGRTDQS